jgi:hypothetical protein
LSTVSKSAKDIIAAARLPERTVIICVRGDLVADIEALEAEAARINGERATNGRMSSKAGAQIKAIAEQVAAKQAEMADHTLTLRVRALKPSVWREILSRYPGKKDSGMVVDLLPFMGEAIPASVVDPELDADDWVNLTGALPNAEMGKLIDAVWELNTQGVDVPKSRLVSAVTQRSSGG